MKTLVVYDSRIGDTAQIAHVIADTLREFGAARLLAVEDVVATDLDELDFLVVGGPTHAHGISVTLARWLKGLPEEKLRHLRCAAFDTRYRMVRFLTGSAARLIERRLGRLGARPVAQPASFFVLGAEGPLAKGEIERAAFWARGFAERVAALRAEAPIAPRGIPGEHWQPHP